MEIIRLKSNQIKKASAVLANSFYYYPMFRFNFPDPNKRTRYLPWYFRNILNCAHRYGEIFTNADLTGVIFYLSPDHNQISLWEYVQNGFLLTPLLMGFQNYQRSMDCEKYVEATRIRLMDSQPHYYLWSLAVDPTNKGKGIGSALINPVLEISDREKIPIYLETHDERNVFYYQKFDFFLERAKIPVHELSFWCMARKPK